MSGQKINDSQNVSLTGLSVQAAADVEGCGSPGRESEEVERIFLKLGLTLFLIHVATLVL